MVCSSRVNRNPRRTQLWKMKPLNPRFIFLLSLTVVSSSFGFYLPGLAPVSFCEQNAKVDAEECQVSFPCSVLIIILPCSDSWNITITINVRHWVNKQIRDFLHRKFMFKIKTYLSVHLWDMTNGQLFPWPPLLRSIPQTDIQLFVNRLDSVESVLPYEYDA